MKQIRLWMFAALLVCGTSVFISCTSDSHDNPVHPEKTFSASTRELKSLVNGNAQLKSLLEKAIAKGVEINPNRETNPVQTLSEYYDFVEWAAHAMPWTVVILFQSGISFTLTPKLFSHQLMGEKLGSLTSFN